MVKFEGTRSVVALVPNFYEWTLRLRLSGHMSWNGYIGDTL